jgi:dipeptidase
MNEHGLALASNCIDCREPNEPVGRGLGWPEIGQLVLQRCRTSREAVEMFGRLIDQYTFNGFENTSCPNLTFIMADAKEGWILEATRHHWVAKRCPDDGGIFYANQAQIGSEYDMGSSDLISYAVANHWYDPKSGKKFSFRDAYGVKLNAPGNTMREERARRLLAGKLGSATVQDLEIVLRDHYEDTTSYVTPHTRTPRTICVSATQSSQIYHLRGDKPEEAGNVMWSLASAPCLGIYTPIWAGYQGGIPQEWSRGSNSFSPDSAWWTFERIQRTAAPLGNTNKESWIREWPAIRERWAATEMRRTEEVEALEMTALKLLQKGSRGEARRLLTEYSNAQFHADFLEARSILNGLGSAKK